MVGSHSAGNRAVECGRPMNYFICSLPRSRTAWIANFLTYGTSFCFHEVFQYLRSGVHGYPELLESTRVPNAGVSDSANTLFIDTLVHLFPHARIVVVRRERSEVDQSMSALGFGFDYTRILDKFERELDRIAEVYESRTLVMDYRALDPTAVWDFCVPSEPVNKQRLRMLRDFNVQIKADVLARNVSSGIEQIRSGDTERYRAILEAGN